MTHTLKTRSGEKVGFRLLKSGRVSVAMSKGTARRFYTALRVKGANKA
jgi:hypothetical protein